MIEWLVNVERKFRHAVASNYVFLFLIIDNIYIFIFHILDILLFPSFSKVEKGNEWAMSPWLEPSSRAWCAAWATHYRRGVFQMTECDSDVSSRVSYSLVWPMSTSTFAGFVVTCERSTVAVKRLYCNCQGTNSYRNR